MVPLAITHQWRQAKCPILPSPGAQSSIQADSGSSEDEAASEARSTTSDCPSLLSTIAEDSLGESGWEFGRDPVGAPWAKARSRVDPLALQGGMPWMSRASRRTLRRS